jgi:ankyrin repeat protein
MSEPLPLPLRANLEWLKKLSKDCLDHLRATDLSAKLSDAQLRVARDYGFSSWRKLKAKVEEVRAELNAKVPPDVLRRAATEVVLPDDPDFARLLGAVAARDAETVTDLLARRPALASARGPDGQTALHMAAQRNDAEVAAILITYGADFEAKFGRYGHSPLSWAVTCHALECARELVKFGARPDLFCAAGMGAIESVETFFDASGEVSAGASRTGSSRYSSDGSLLPCPPPAPREQISDALYIACRNGQAGVVRFLLGKQPDLGFRAYLGATPLHWAYFGGSHEIVEMLEGVGADPAARDDALGCTPRAFGICVPANWGFADFVRRRLAEDPGLVNVMDGPTSPLHEAARNNNADVVRLLLDHGANASLLNGDGKTPLDVTDPSNIEIVEMLRKAGGPRGGDPS